MQLRLFDPENPLRERFSESFFRRLPTSPGVYWMQDRFGRVIYVGKAKNLRARLRSYRAKKFTSLPIKTQRLLLNVHEIHWEETPDEMAAFLLESEYLRALRPRFNVIGTTSGSYSYFSFSESDEGFTLELTVGHTPESKNRRVFGAYRGIASVRYTHAALARWLWVNARGRCDWPVLFYKPLLPAHVFIPWSANEGSPNEISREMIPAYIEVYLLGFAPLPEIILPDDEPSPLLQMIWRDDQIRLARFFHSCESLRRLREKFHLGDRPLSISEVDDLRIIAREASRRHFEYLCDN